MKRMLCIVSSLNTGGAETFLMKIFRNLPDGYKMDFVTSQAGGYYEEEIKKLGGRVYVVPLRTKHPIAVYKSLKRIVKDNGYDSVLKLCDTPIGAFDLMAAKSGGASHLCVRSCNAASSESFLRKTLNAMLRPILNKLATIKIAPSDLAAIYTFGKKQYESGKVHLLNNAVDLTVFRHDEDARNVVRSEFSLNGKTVIGHIGRFNSQKNHAFLLDVFKCIKERDADAVLMLVGTGELQKEVENKAAEIGIEASVIFAGVRSDIPALLSAMDVFVFPSFFEGMPNTVIEAQATGLPCLIADTITKSADITGIVSYMPLSQSPDEWAKRACEMAVAERKNTHPDFVEKKYDIQSSVNEFVKLCMESE